MRYYNAWTCRFVSVDPIANEYQSSYVYADNNPVMMTDPTGGNSEKKDGGGGGSSSTTQGSKSEQTTGGSTAKGTEMSKADLSVLHNVEKGNTLSQLASDYGTTVDNLMELNPQIKDANNIKIGETIMIQSSEQTIAKIRGFIDSLESDNKMEPGKFTPDTSLKGDNTAVNRGAVEQGAKMQIQKTLSYNAAKDFLNTKSGGSSRPTLPKDSNNQAASKTDNPFNGFDVVDFTATGGQIVFPQASGGINAAGNVAMGVKHAANIYKLYKIQTGQIKGEFASEFALEFSEIGVDGAGFFIAKYLGPQTGLAYVIVVGGIKGTPARVMEIKHRVDKQKAEQKARQGFQMNHEMQYFKPAR